MKPTGNDMIDKTQAAVRAVNEMAEAWSNETDRELTHKLRLAVGSVRQLAVRVQELTGAEIDLDAGLSRDDSPLRCGHLRLVPRDGGE